jgi:hypothetical protein
MEAGFRHDWGTSVRVMMSPQQLLGSPRELLCETTWNTTGGGQILSAKIAVNTEVLYHYLQASGTQI